MYVSIPLVPMPARKFISWSIGAGSVSSPYVKYDCYKEEKLDRSPAATTCRFPLECDQVAVLGLVEPHIPVHSRSASQHNSHSALAGE